MLGQQPDGVNGREVEDEVEVIRPDRRQLLFSAGAYGIAIGVPVAPMVVLRPRPVEVAVAFGVAAAVAALFWIVHRRNRIEMHPAGITLVVARRKIVVPWSEIGWVYEMDGWVVGASLKFAAQGRSFSTGVHRGRSVYADELFDVKARRMVEWWMRHRGPDWEPSPGHEVLTPAGGASAIG